MREYDYNPRPTVESHFHIRELIEAQEKRAHDREYHHQRIKQGEEREQEIKTAPNKEVKFFYCSRCKKDFIGEAFKHIEQDWTNGQRFASYKTKCYCGKWAARFITDRLQDPYSFRSRRVAQEREAHHNDLLQSFQTNYSLVYGKNASK